MKVITIPLMEDNYGYLLVDESTKETAIVDVASQPKIMMNAVSQHGLSLVKVLTTHKHWDHAGGNNEVKTAFPNIEICGSRLDNVEGCTKFVGDGDEFMVTKNIKVSCIVTPGHTQGHVCYLASCEGAASKILFTGDCLFVGGCGRFFEGTAADMYPALAKLAALPEDTEIYCGHEYTTANYKFNLSVQPKNPHLLAANEALKQKREANIPSVPSTIGQERLTNPFLQCCDLALYNSFNPVANQDGVPACEDTSDPVAVLGHLRERKNKFK
jgi:hydroxyacylglutathione hydrolase